jgi:5-methylcytosine-specific restriction endonuclease McrA
VYRDGELTSRTEIGVAVQRTALDDAMRPRMPRHRPKVSDRRMATTRLAVYVRDGFACVDCGWKPDPPLPGYDGSYALCGPTPADANRNRSRRHWLAATRRLELDHVVPYLRGGKFEIDNLAARCSTCNSRKGASA